MIRLTAGQFVQLTAAGTMSFSVPTAPSPYAKLVWADVRDRVFVVLRIGQMTLDKWTLDKWVVDLLLGDQIVRTVIGHTGKVHFKTGNYAVYMREVGTDE